MVPQRFAVLSWRWALLPSKQNGGSVNNMKSFLAVGLLTLAATALCAQDTSSGGAGSTAAMDKEILDAEQAWRDATFKSDAAAMEHLLRLDYMRVDSDGTVWTKRDLPPGPKNPPKAKPVLNAFKVRTFGDVAIVTGGETWPDPPAITNRFLHVWLKTDGKWEMSIEQITRVKGTAKVPAKSHAKPASKT